MFQSLEFADNLMWASYSASPEALPHGIQDVNRVTAEEGMRAGFQFMNDGYTEEDAIAQAQMKRPDRAP